MWSKSVVFLLVLLLSNCVVGLGITPASKQLDFQPGVEKTIVYRLYNTEAKDFTARINVSGSLKQYIILDQEEIAFAKEDKVKSFTLTVRFPQEIEPGASATINVVGLTKDASASLNLAANIGVTMPTGSLVAEQPDAEKKAPDVQAEESGSPLLMIAMGLLVVIAVGNIVFFTYNRRLGTRQAPVQAALESAVQGAPVHAKHEYGLRLCFSDGTPVSNLGEMLYFVQNLSEETFRSYVNDSKNDIAMWTDVMLKEPRLALRIYDTTERQVMINAFNVYIQAMQQQDEQRQAAAALKEEVEKLKQDLEVL